MKRNEKIFYERPSDIISELYQELHEEVASDGDAYLFPKDASRFCRRLQEAFKQVRQLENEVSATRWNSRSELDAHVDDAKVIVFDPRRKHRP